MLERSSADAGTGFYAGRDGEILLSEFPVGSDVTPLFLHRLPGLFVYRTKRRITCAARNAFWIIGHVR